MKKYHVERGAGWTATHNTGLVGVDCYSLIPPERAEGMAKAIISLAAKAREYRECSKSDNSPPTKRSGS